MTAGSYVPQRAETRLPRGVSVFEETIVMAYGPEATELRRCRALTKTGEPCRAFSRWRDSRGFCASHGAHHRGPLDKEARRGALRSAYEPCTCVAYAWPHRPAGGLCRWPLPPTYRRTTEAGTHGSIRLDQEPPVHRQLYRFPMNYD